MSEIETVDAKDENETEGREAFASLREPPIINDVVETNEAVNEERTQEETKEETPKPKAKAKTKPRVSVELVECDDCAKRMLPKSLRFSHHKHCKRAPTEALPVKPPTTHKKVKTRSERRD